MSSPLLDAVAVMDRLRSPGGCPWDAAQTHRSLAKYLLEETYETLEAIETDDLALLREELGDLLLQVLFHARLAEELPEGQRFSIDDVARDLVTKLVHRHPHVFADTAVSGADEVNENWEQLKAAEKGRASAVDGVPMGQPALALAAKLVSRGRRAGIDASVATSGIDASVATSGVGASVATSGIGASVETSGIGDRLLAIVRDAVAEGVDPEQALRESARAYREALLRAESR
jgi:XTP/dITP diphosphohydrolase